jgi:hypothetical protein
LVVKTHFSKKLKKKDRGLFKKDKEKLYKNKPKNRRAPKEGGREKKNNRPKYCRKLNDLKKTVATVDTDSAVVWSSTGAKL